MIKRRKRWTTLEIIKEFKKVHGNTYDYSDFIFNTMHSKGNIKCSIHGIFQQEPNAHIRQKQGCPLCGRIKTVASITDTTDSFITKAKSIHGDLFDYSKTVYGPNAHSKVIIICKYHGEILISPNSHLSKKAGCLVCANLSGGWTKERWVIACGNGRAKLYLVECFNETELFYKMGATYKTVSSRLNGKHFPYKYRILKLVENNAETIYDLERELQLKFYSLRYQPEIWFDGHTECFRPDQTIIEAYASIH